MKRLLRAHSTFLTVLFLAAGCCAALIVLFLADSPANAAQSASNLMRAPVLPVVGFASKAIPLLGSPGVITCTNIYTTIADSIGGETGNDFVTAAYLAPYQDLSLVGTVGINQSKQVFTETFRLDNVQVGTKYKVEAIPNQTTNYNLGITVYNRTYQIFGTPDENPTDFRAVVEFIASDIGPYFVKVYQITQQCSGGTYDLDFGYTAATPTPTPTATPTSQPWAQQDSDEPNENINSAKVLVNLTGRTFFNITSGYADPRDDNDWYSLYGAAGYQYTVSAARESGTTDLYFFMEIYAPDKTTRLGVVDSSTNPSINWTASIWGNHYIHIRRATGSPTNATYKITVTTNTSPSDSPDIYDTPPNNNDTINAAAFLFQYQVTGLTLYNAVLYPSSPGDDQDWFIIPATLAGYQYIVSATPDNIYPAFNMQVYGPNKPILIAQVLGASNPTIGWFAPNTGYYFVRLWRASGSPTSGTYHLNWSALPNFVYLPIILK